MRRGTTPTHTFTLPFAVPADAAIRIVYAQNNAIKVEKTASVCAVLDNTIVTKLTAEETLRFDCTPHWFPKAGYYAPYPVEIQIGIKTGSGDSESTAWSDIIETTVEKCLKEDGAV